MTLAEAIELALDENDNVEDILKQWDETENRMVIAKFIAHSLASNNGKFSFKDVAFLFILGIRTGQILERDLVLSVIENKEGH